MFFDVIRYVITQKYIVYLPWFTLKDHTTFVYIPIIPQVFELFLQVFQSPCINEQSVEKEEKEEEKEEKAAEKQNAAEHKNCWCDDRHKAHYDRHAQPVTTVTGPWRTSHGQN